MQAQEFPPFGNLAYWIETYVKVCSLESCWCTRFAPWHLAGKSCIGEMASPVPVPDVLALWLRRPTHIHEMPAKEGSVPSPHVCWEQRGSGKKGFGDVVQENTGRLSGGGGFGPTDPHICTYRSTHSDTNARHQSGHHSTCTQVDMYTHAFQSVHTWALMHGSRYHRHTQPLPRATAHAQPHLPPACASLRPHPNRAMFVKQATSSRFCLCSLCLPARILFWSLTSFNNGWAPAAA